MGYSHLDRSLCAQGFHRFVLGIPARMKAQRALPADILVCAQPTLFQLLNQFRASRWRGRLLYEFPRQSHVV